MYVSFATPDTKHWWIGVVEAPTLEALGDAEVRTAFAGDEQTAVKDPIVQRPRGCLARLGLLPPARPPGRGGPHELRPTPPAPTAWRGTGTAPCSRAATASGTRAARG